MKTDIQKIVLRTWGLMMSTSQTWEEIFNDAKEKSFKKYFIPLLLLCVAFVVAFKTIYADSKHIQTGFIYGVIALIAYLCSFYLIRYFVNKFLNKYHADKSNALIIEKLIVYSFSVVFAIKLITTIIPSLFFLQILNVYTVYIVWEGCRLKFDVNEDERGKIMLIIGGSIMFLPAIISKIILFMIPGF
jgi:hypothetical protein